MKIGFVVECGRDGPEKKVFEYLVKTLRKDGATTRITTCGGKNWILKECGAYVATLFAEGCDHVFVVWDLMPCDAEHHHRGEPSCEKEREHILQLIARAHRDRTTMLCITHELEAWLLADGGALTALLKELSVHPVKPAVADYKRPEEVTDPKNELKRVFKRHHRREYDGRMHAHRIIENVKDFAKLERASPSFKRFKQRLESL